MKITYRVYTHCTGLGYYLLLVLMKILHKFRGCSCVNKQNYSVLFFLVMCREEGFHMYSFYQTHQRAVGMKWDGVTKGVKSAYKTLENTF